MHFCRGLFLLMLLIFISRGCASPPPVEMARSPDEADPRSSRIIGFSVEGRPIECCTIGRGSVVTLLLAGIHGNEPAGTPLLVRVMNELEHAEDLPADARVLVITIANPDGLADGTRSNARGVDLNRNFPADNWRGRRSRGGETPLSEPEARALHQLILDEQPSLIVSIHQPLACIDYDGPARDLAFEMATCCDLPVRKLGGQPGSLGSWAGQTLGIPIITLELPRIASNLNADELLTRYGDALLAAIHFSPAGRPELIADR
jgi:protein MpaA